MPAVFSVLLRDMGAEKNRETFMTQVTTSLLGCASLQSLMQCYAQVENKSLDSQFSNQLL